MNYYLILPLIGGAAGYFLTKDKQSKERWGIAGAACGLAVAYVMDQLQGGDQTGLPEDEGYIEELPAGGTAQQIAAQAVAADVPAAAAAYAAPATVAAPATTPSGRLAAPLVKRAKLPKLGVKSTSGIKVSPLVKVKKASSTTQSRFRGLTL